MRGLTRASKALLAEPPAGFASVPLLAPRGTLLVARDEQLPDLQRAHDECSGLVDNLRWCSAAEVCTLVPCFAPGQVAAGLLEPDAKDIDVHALHHGFLRGMRARHGTLVCNAAVRAVGRYRHDWRVQTDAGEFAAPLLVNAAGAWADEIAQLAGAAEIGLVPKRRTAITFDPPAGAASEHWPAVIDIDEDWYFKPDAGRILASPADETPSPPCDAQPDEYDVAVLVDRLTRFTTLQVPRIHARWAGLRSFVADKTIVAGFDAQIDGFFWLAAQGGYGIQTAPAAARAAAALIERRPLPADIADLGVNAAALSPGRLAPFAETPPGAG
jgi:D-arginine dehydrogenase